MRIAATILLGLALSSSAIAQSLELVYSKQIPNIHIYSEMDPILNRDGELDGFVFYSPDTALILVDHWSADVTMPVGLHNGVTRIINRVDEHGSLQVYALVPSASARYGLYLDRVSVNAHGFSIYPTEPRTFPTGGIQCIEPCYMIEQGLRWERDEAGIPQAVIVEVRQRTSIYETTMGTYDSDHSTVIHYPLDLASELYRVQRTHEAEGNFCSANGANRIALNNRYEAHSGGDPGDPPNYESSWMVLEAFSNDDGLLLNKAYDSASGEALFAGDFVADEPGAEFIYQGSVPLIPDQTGWGPTYVGCYSLDGDSIVKHWGRFGEFEVAAITGEPGNQIAWSVYYNFLERIDCATGQSLIDVLMSLEDIPAVRIFEAGISPKSVYVAQRISDSLYVYRFEVTTDIDDDELPAKFELSEAYPNPFNPSTSCTLVLDQTADVLATVYNLLGQEVRTILSAPLSPGQHRLTWDGRDNSGRAMASGVYLIGVKAGEMTATRKLVLLK